MFKRKSKLPYLPYGRVSSWIMFAALVKLIALSSNAIAQSGTLPSSIQNTPSSANTTTLAIAQQSEGTKPSSPSHTDPIGSPFPVPWKWVWTNQAQAKPGSQPFNRYYRSRSLVSPDSRFAAYSQITMQVQPEFTESRISSEIIIENLKTGELQKFSASAHLSRNFLSGIGTVDEPGVIAILIPVAWSKTSDRLLVRQFESLFGSDVATDYALTWNTKQKQLHAFAPTAVDYDTAVLLGWSQAHPEKVLFQTSILGQATTSLWQVDLQGESIAAPRDHALIFGRTIDQGAGPRAYR